MAKKEKYPIMHHSDPEMENHEVVGHYVRSCNGFIERGIREGLWDYDMLDDSEKLEDVIYHIKFLISADVTHHIRHIVREYEKKIEELKKEGAEQ